MTIYRVRSVAWNAIKLADARRGKPVARLTAATRPRKRVDATLLGALTATMPAQAEAAADLVRSMRDGDRY
jgi:antitoxin (DNA-binding transcriptional repressor) of toxin-antitoxin stability system